MPAGRQVWRSGCSARSVERKRRRNNVKKCSVSCNLKLFIDLIRERSEQFCLDSMDCTARVVDRHVDVATGKLGVPFIEFSLGGGRCTFQYPVNQLLDEVFGDGAALRAGYPIPQAMEARERHKWRCRSCRAAVDSNVAKRRLRRNWLKPSTSSTA